MDFEEEEQDFMIISAQLHSGMTAYYVYLQNGKFLFDVDLVPDSCVLAGLGDGTAVVELKIDDQPKLFMFFDWVINEWGGDPELVRRIASRLEDLKEHVKESKIGFNNENLRDQAKDSRF